MAKKKNRASKMSPAALAREKYKKHQKVVAYRKRLKFTDYQQQILGELHELWNDLNSIVVLTNRYGRHIGDDQLGLYLNRNDIDHPSMVKRKVTTITLVSPVAYTATTPQIEILMRAVSSTLAARLTVPETNKGCEVLEPVIVPHYFGNHIHRMDISFIVPEHPTIAARMKLKPTNNQMLMVHSIKEWGVIRPAQLKINQPLFPSMAVKLVSRITCGRNMTQIGLVCDFLEENGCEILQDNRTDKRAEEFQVFFHIPP